MMDETPALTPEDVREEAREILLAIDASRNHRAEFEANWRKLWQLVREARAAHLPELDNGPWHLSTPRVGGQSLTAGGFSVPIWLPEEARRGTDIPGLLNWAGVPSCMDNIRSGDRNAESAERARETAERRREQEELHRRLSEEGREVAETLRGRHEEFREDSERLRDTQEASRELAEQAREMAECFRRTAEEARTAVNDAREALAELKDLAQRQRDVLERQERALASFESRTRESGS